MNIESLFLHKRLMDKICKAIKSFVPYCHKSGLRNGWTKQYQHLFHTIKAIQKGGPMCDFFDILRPINHKDLINL